MPRFPQFVCIAPETFPASIEHDYRALVVWRTMLRLAVVRDTTFYWGRQRIDLERGELCISRRKLSVEAQLTDKQVRGALDRLKAAGKLTSRSVGSRVGKLWTCCGYEKEVQLHGINTGANAAQIGMRF